MKQIRIKIWAALLMVLVAAVPGLVFAKVVELKNPLAFIGVQEPVDLVVSVLGAFSAIIASVAIAFTVFNGFKMIIAGGNEESLTKAKEGLKWSVGGLAAALLSFTIISSVANFVGFTPDEIDLTKDEIKNPIILPGDRSGLGASASFIDVLNFVMINFLGLMGFATTLMIIYYGFKYITAAGNEELIEQAKIGLKWSLLGLAVALLAFTIINVVRSYLLFGA